MGGYADAASHRLIGEYAELIPTVAPDVLRQLAQTFVTEVRGVHDAAWAWASRLLTAPHKRARARCPVRPAAPTQSRQDDIVKLQIVTLAAKLYLAGLDRADVLLPYVFSLAKYDLNYDIRDRVRAPLRHALTATNRQACRSSHMGAIAIAMALATGSGHFATTGPTAAGADSQRGRPRPVAA